MILESWPSLNIGKASCRLHGGNGKINWIIIYKKKTIVVRVGNDDDRGM